MNNIIVGMGEALWDVLPEGKKIGSQDQQRTRSGAPGEKNGQDTCDR